ncbi:MAG TPA: ATP-binding protein [Solirubrobacteraceae bacterium]|jgi:anti-sigma regulatory factor (Ser/Thr protein kinase)|nr:ATP-binding protein [Solirubrobacteraceae bacterium]
MTTELHATITGGPYAAAAARRALGGLATLVDRHRLDDISLLVSELVTNGVRHGGAGEGDVLELTVLRNGSRLRVVVTDAGPGFEGRARPRERADEAGGWGLFLVERLADRWGVERDGAATAVWFELGIDVGAPVPHGGAASRPERAPFRSLRAIAFS